MYVLTPNPPNDILPSSPDTKGLKENPQTECGKAKRMYRKLKRNEVPKRTRISIPKLSRTKEWKAMKADIDAGLKPNEALQIVLNDEDKAKYGIKSRRACSRFIKAYLAEKKLPYTVKSFSRNGEGDFFIVEYTPVLKRTA